jgi:hypothetical protein
MARANAAIDAFELGGQLVPERRGARKRGALKRIGRIRIRALAVASTYAS